MAEVFDPLSITNSGSSIAQTASNTAGAVGQTMMYIFIALIVGAIILGIFYILSFKHKVIVYKATNSGTVVFFTKARELKTKEGIPKWRFLNSKLIKQTFPAPSNDFVQLSDKGQFVAHASFSLDGTFNWKKVSNSPNSLDSFSSEEKLMSVVEMRRAMEYVKTKWTDKLLIMAPAMIVLMILVVFMIFFGDVVKPFKDAAASNAALTEKVIEANAQLVTTSERLAIASERLAQAYYGMPVTPPINYTLINNNNLKPGTVVPN